MKRFIKWTVVVVLVLIVVGVSVVLLSIDRIILSTVQTQGTSSLNLATTLQSAHFALFGGNLNLKELEIASPSGYDAPHMLVLGEADVGVHYGQLWSNPVHIEHVTLTRPWIEVEQKNGAFNFQVVMKGGGQSSGAAQPQPQPPAQPGEPLKVIIDKLTLVDAQVTIRAGIPGLDKALVIPIPTVVLSDVGAKTNGAQLKDVIMQVFTALLEQAKNSDKMPKSVQALLHMNIGDVTGELGGEASKVLETGEGAVGNTINNLMGGQKNQK